MILMILPLFGEFPHILRVKGLKNITNLEECLLIFKLAVDCLLDKFRYHPKQFYFFLKEPLQ